MVGFRRGRGSVGSGLVACVCMVAVVMSAHTAVGQSGPSGSAKSETEKAQKHFDRGAELYVQGEYSQAVVEFRKAQRIRRHPIFLYNIVRSYARLDRCQKVRETARRIEDRSELGAEPSAKLAATVRACRQIQRTRGRVDAVANRVERERDASSRARGVVAEGLGRATSRVASRRDERSTDGAGEGSDQPADPAGNAARATNSVRIHDVLKWSSLGVGGALLGTAVVYDWASTRDRIEAVGSSESVSQSRLRRLEARARRSRRTAIVMYAVGGGLVATGVTLSIVTSGGAKTRAGAPHAAEDRATVSLEFGPPVRMLQLDARW